MSFHFDAKRHCQDLRAKEMFAQEPRDPRREEEIAEIYGTHHGTAFWCRLTQTGRGPDGARVDQDLCCRARRCFTGIEDLK